MTVLSVLFHGPSYAGCGRRRFLFFAALSGAVFYALILYLLYSL